MKTSNTNIQDKNMTPVEKPLVGLQEIADYLQKSERTIRRYRSLRGFPIYRKSGTGTLFSFPSELNAWIRSR